MGSEAEEGLEMRKRVFGKAIPNSEANGAVFDSESGSVKSCVLLPLGSREPWRDFANKVGNSKTQSRIICLPNRLTKLLMKFFEL